MTTGLHRPHDVSRAVETQLAREMCDQGIFQFDPRISLMMPVCGLASHSLAKFLVERRPGHDISVRDADRIPKIAKFDRGYRHALIVDNTAETVIDATPLQILHYAGYLMNYPLDIFPTPPEELVGEVRIAEFPNSAEGTAEFAQTITGMVEDVAVEARTIRDKFDMRGGQPFLDMGHDEVYETLIDVWNLDHYRVRPTDELEHDYAQRVYSVTQRLLEVDALRVE